MALDHAVYTSLDDLIALGIRAKGFDFLPRQPAHSILCGRRASRMRGRGLNFEELRAYLPGDDIRSIDWKVTARTHKPHVRVYTEERDRPAILIVDQRIAMFFGTRLSLKSVAAAHAASLAAWRITAVGDRVGAIVFNDAKIQEIRPHRSRHNVLRILHAIVEQNRELRADREPPPDTRMLDRALNSVRAMTPQSHLICIISDFDGAGAETEKYMMGLAVNNDVLAVLVYDPLFLNLPPSRDFVITNGELQVEMHTGKAVVRRGVEQLVDERAKRILGWQSKYGIPVLPVSAAEDVTHQLRHLLGHLPARRRH